MSRLNSTLIALVLSAAAAAGLFAAVRTVRLGQSVSTSQTVPVTAREVAARRAKLAHWSRSLERTRAKRPPALPKIPKLAPVQAAPPPASVQAAATAPTAPPVKYVRPAPIVKYQHAAQPTTTTQAQSWSEDAGEQGESGGDGSGGD